MASIQQLNMHHCEAAAAEIGSIADSLYLLQEPYYVKGRPQVRKQSQFHSAPEGRAAIYASALQSFSFVPMHQFTDHDISVGIIEGGCLKHPIVIASIYLHGKSPTILPKMKELVNFCISKKKRLICQDMSESTTAAGNPRSGNP